MMIKLTLFHINMGMITKSKQTNKKTIGIPITTDADLIIYSISDEYNNGIDRQFYNQFYQSSWK